MKKDKISGEELSAFCSQVALILGAGIPLADGMETIIADQDSDLYRKLAEKVAETGSLYEGFQTDDRWPVYLREMTALGERTGEMETVMKELSEYYDREARISASVQSAVAYPLTLGAMLVVIVLILLWKVLPVFRRVLSSMGVGMTESGSALMSIGTAIGWVVLAVVGLLLLAVLAVVILLRTKARSRVMALLKKLVPLFGKVSRKLSASRVASVFSMMLHAGFPMEEALTSLPAVLDDEEAEGKVAVIVREMENGEPFAEALTASELFDPLHSRMIRMGVAAGCEDQVMGKVAGIYEEQVEENISRLVSIIEPTLVALLSVVIGAVLLSVMLPMTGILSSMM